MHMNEALMGNDQLIAKLKADIKEQNELVKKEIDELTNMLEKRSQEVEECQEDLATELSERLFVVSDFDRKLEDLKE